MTINPAPQVARLYQRRRPGDTALACTVSEEEGERTFEVIRAGETSRLQGSPPLVPSTEKPMARI